MHTFEQFMLQERQKGEKLGLSQKQPKDQLYGHSAAHSFLDALRRSGADLSNYGITMTELPKVGINPKSRYNTPLGVYFYPADYYYNLIDDDTELPFQHDAKYINILKFKSSSNILHLDEDPEKFEKLWKKIIEITKNEKRVLQLRQSDNYRKFAESSPAKEFFYGIIELTSREGGGGRNSTQSNRLLAKLGIDIVIDSKGRGIIHHSERTQGFLIDGSKATVIRRIESTPPQRSNLKLSPEATINVIMNEPHYKLTTKDIAILASDGVVAYKYALYTQKRFIAGEPAIIKDEALNLKAMINYFQKFVKGPFPAAAEDALISRGGANLTWQYARDIIKGPFPKGEEVIAQDAGASFEYATKVLNGRFIKGEPAIMQDKYAFFKERYLERFGPIDS